MHPHDLVGLRWSGPARDLWIEIINIKKKLTRQFRSGPARDLWIEIDGGYYFFA